ncbi:hypothetical protein LMG23992_05235 [Cupriavidus laharis]|uniref:Sulfatase N-terminal domain-containing protein n=1 Tax=Cupriavidus laharis TaxID=151654 RepID=A0ABM8XVR9_9BURK|nr:arylsulfatase [Cupriavidus laharis]CAG9184452.1 hypothetical protein LMG23992_05235 [Cupriavidus laharis]
MVNKTFTQAQDATGAVLPPLVASASVAGKTLAESRHQWRVSTPLKVDGAPNVLIVLLDDAGFAQADTVGGPIHTPTFSRIANSGLTYNAFHTTAICSATRASLLTGRNHHKVGNGVISELASDWDGYTAEIPKSAATIPEVLKHYGYRTAAFGKWHNTPVRHTTSMGPFDRWPTGHGFDHFYGFIGGETSQYEPRLYQGTTPIEPPRRTDYHLSEDLAEKAVQWLKDRSISTPEDPFFMYWAPGAVHGPHHVFKEWADKYKGKFDAGWDICREQAFERQKRLGFIPPDAVLTPRPSSLPGWDSLGADERKFQARLMEVFAGFLEHVDVQVGKIVDEIERQGLRENTLIFYVFSDNGASAEGMAGSIAELNAHNGITTPVSRHMEVLEQLGGLDMLGSARVDNMYHAAWAWAGMSPFQGTKLVAGYFGGTRVPLAISWPQRIRPDSQVRPQFHHVNDIAPTIYEAIGITPPRVVDGHEQDPLDGVGMSYTFSSGQTANQKLTQYFEVLGSRGIFHQGWMASVWGPRTPWIADMKQFHGWNPEKDVWALYNLDEDFSQSQDLAAQEPARLEAMKTLFDREAQANKVYPLGAGLWPFLQPSDRVGPRDGDVSYGSKTRRIPEFMGPNLRSRNSIVTVDVDVPENAQGVLYALGGAGGGVTLYIDSGYLTYEYNALLLERTVLRATEPISRGRRRIEVKTMLTSSQPGAAASLGLHIDGEEVARASVPYTLPLAFTATETFNVGVDLGSPVSFDYLERAPFAFNGTVHDVHVTYPPETEE